MTEGDVIESEKVLEEYLKDVGHVGLEDTGDRISRLQEAGEVNVSRQMKEHVTIPLKEQNESDFRLYMGDVGLMSPAVPPVRNTMSDIFVENYAANELTAKGIPLFYWKGKNGNEVPFIVRKGDTVISVDVKENDGSLSAYRKVNQKEEAVKIRNIPLYQTFLFADEVKQSRYF